jgi:hypothetical protein
MTGVLAPSPVATERSSAGLTDASAQGHCVDLQHREDGFGSVTTLIHPPVKVIHSSNPSAPVSFMHNSRVLESANVGAEFLCPGRSIGVGHGNLPKLSFPVFDGENPKL